MEKKLLVKVQKIGGLREEKTLKLSTPLIIESEEDVSSKRGSLYAVVEASSSSMFDAVLVRKIVDDTLQNDYFNNPDGTPLQCLEKAAAVVREKVLSVINADKDSDASIAEFHAIMAVLWGSVLYVIQYGYGCSYLIREGRIKAINTLSEGDFSIASGMVRDDDIVILGSRGFCESVSPEGLLKNAAELLGKDENAAIVLKFSINRDTGSYSVLNFKEGSPSNSKPRSVNLPSLKLPRFLGKKTKLLLLTVIVGGLFVFSLFMSLGKNRQPFPLNYTSSVMDQAKGALSEASKFIGTDDEKARKLLLDNKKLLEEAKSKFSSKEVDLLLEEYSKNLDQANKIFRIKENPFYDLKVDDQSADPLEMALADSSKLLISEPVRNRFHLLTLPPSISYASLQSTQAAQPRMLSSVEAGVDFVAEDSFYTFDSGTTQIKAIASKFDFPLKSAKAFASYIGNFYVVDGSSILKNNVSWVKDESNLSEAVSLAIDGSIYVLGSSGKVLKYSSGTRESFSLSGFEEGFASPSQIYTSSDFDNLYILDGKGGKVVVFDKSGKYVKQYVIYESSKISSDLRSLSVSGDEKHLYVLAGTRIYKINL